MQWTCEACTFVNEVGSQCEACGTPANGPAASGSRSDDEEEDDEESEENVSFAEEEEDTSDVPAELAEGFKRIQEELDQQAAQELQELQEKARRKREEELKRKDERRKLNCQLGRVDAEALLAHVRARLPEQAAFDHLAEGPRALRPLIGDYFNKHWNELPTNFDDMLRGQRPGQLRGWITRGLTPSAGDARYAKYMNALAAGNYMNALAAGNGAERIRLPELYVVQLSTAFVHLSYRAAPLSIGSEERSRL